MKTLRPLVLGIGPLLFAACATGPGRESRPVVEFPSQSALASIEARPTAPVPIEEVELPAVAWTVPGAQAATTLFEPWTPATEGERLLAGLLPSGAAVHLTKGLSCVAREVGRFLADYQKPPPESLREFIFGACGTVAREVGIIPFGGPVSAAASDAAVLAAWHDDLARHLASQLPRDASELGLWYGRQNGQALAVAIYDHLEVRLRPFSLVPDASGEVTVEGDLPGEVAYVSGYINNGRYAADSCFVDPTVSLPHFRISCRMNEGDTTAWIQLLQAQPRRVLAVAFAQFIARRDPTAALEHRPEVYGQPHAVASADEFSQTAFAALNEVRQAAGLATVRLAPVESVTATSLAPHYFSAWLDKKDPEVLNTIALGMLAGWQVGGMIRDASFVSALVPHTRDAGRWVSEVLATPVGRVALMDPNIEEVALGPTVRTGPDALGAVVAGYRFHHGNDHTADVRRLFFQLLAGRKRRGLPTPQRLALIDQSMHDELARVNEGQQQPGEALQKVLEAGLRQYGADVGGYIVEATSLNAVHLPPEILEQPTLQLGIGVTHFKPPGAAWAQLVVVIVYIAHPVQGA